MRHDHPENHLISRVGSLRAAVLNANDGITSTASLVMGVASAASNSDDALNAGVAACAGRTGIGCHILGKYCCTSDAAGAITHGLVTSRWVSRFIDLSGAARDDWRESERCRNDQAQESGDLLGYPARNHRDRCCLWKDPLMFRVDG